MSSINHDRCPDAALLNSVKYVGEEKKCDENLLEPTSHLSQVTSSELSSTLASMKTLQNIAVSEAAPHAIIPSSSHVGQTYGNRSNSSFQPYTVHSSPCFSRNIDNRAAHQASWKSQSKHSDHSVIRRGKWSPEEEEYANAVVREFNSGYLDAKAGTTLRIYLSEKLQCDPMRITKKFTGNDSIGKRVFHPAGRVGDGLTKEAKDAQSNLDDLYQKWKKRLEQQDQEYARKALAAQAVSQAASMSGMGLNKNNHMPLVFSSEVNHSEALRKRTTENAIHTTAMWLSRVASVTSVSASRSRAEIENELRIIARLVDEGPTVLATASELAAQSRIQFHQPFITIPNNRKRKYCSEGTHTLGADSNPMKLLASISSHAAPVPIVNKTSSKTESEAKPINRSVSIADQEDAETFVHFLKSVS